MGLLETLEASEEQESQTPLTTSSEHLDAWRNLVRSPGWALLAEQMDYMVSDAINKLIEPGEHSESDDYLKGKISAIKTIASTPHAMIETLSEDLERLEQQQEEDEDDENNFYERSLEEPWNG